LEFALARATLRQFGLSTPAEVLAGRADLWAYASGELAPCSLIWDGRRPSVRIGPARRISQQ
jgi:hypothetical protein